MAKVTHGMSRTTLYHRWQAMKQKGVVCKEWENDFQAFCGWAIANGYKAGLYINRIDKGKGFSPENLKIEMKKGSINGGKRARTLTYNGETHSVADWADKLGMKRITLYKRLDYGYSIKKALTQPIDTRKGNHIRREK